MLKENELRHGITVCDRCSERATVIVGSRALCQKHASEKQASADLPLKSSAAALSERHKS
jgi:hypothetical protein